MPEYSAKLNLEKPLGTENVNRDFFIRLIDDIDSKAGTVNGLARLDQNGNVLKADGSLAGEVTAAQFTEHKEERATVQKAGHVQLSDAITSTDTTKAATSNAVKKAYDRADAAFTSASNGKTAIANAVAGVDPRVVVPADPTFAQLVEAVGKIKTGKEFAVGKVSGLPTAGSVQVTGLPFTPSAILMQITSNSNGNQFVGSSVGYVLLNNNKTAEVWESTGSLSSLFRSRPTGNSFTITTGFISSVTNISAEWIALKEVGFFV